MKPLLESADGSMATVATRREKKRAYQKHTRITLTPTGLLMEGDFTDYLKRRPGRQLLV